jgi:hypothetical protein
MANNVAALIVFTNVPTCGHVLESACFLALVVQNVIIASNAVYCKLLVKIY